MADNPQLHKTPLIFYRSEPGKEPVRAWLQDLLPVERQEIGKDLPRAQWRWPIGMPLCRPLSKAIFAQRIEKVKLARYRNSAPIIPAFRQELPLAASRDS